MKISEEKKNKISEQILSLLYDSFPNSKFTAHVARELARDEEFIKKILLELKYKKLVLEVNQNSKGITYIKRSRWRLSNNSYNAYKNSL